MPIESFPFGRDGEPAYVPGPNDSPGKMRAIQRALTKAHGPDGWTTDIGAHLAQLQGLIADDSLEIDDLSRGLVTEHEGSTGPRQG